MENNINWVPENIVNILNILNLENKNLNQYIVIILIEETLKIENLLFIYNFDLYLSFNFFKFNF